MLPYERAEGLDGPLLILCSQQLAGVAAVDPSRLNFELEVLVPRVLGVVLLAFLMHEFLHFGRAFDVSVVVNLLSELQDLGVYVLPSAEFIINQGLQSLQLIVALAFCGDVGSDLLDVLLERSLIEVELVFCWPFEFGLQDRGRLLETLFGELAETRRPSAHHDAGEVSFGILHVSRWD